MSTFSANLSLTQAAITGIVDKLETQGFVSRARSDEDRRVVKIKMTLKGEHALRKAERIHGEFTEQTLGSLDESELDSLNLILQKLVKSTSKLSMEK
jgi:DNA-binding MarR family transcriptional regulator